MSTAAVGRCIKCNRILKDPVSIERSIGPVCYRKKDIQLAVNEQLDPFDPATKNISMRRVDGRPVFNIPQTHRHHSPTGMEYGYGGSGPADFALNILALFLPAAPQGPKVKCWDGTFVSRDAWNLHQQFKRDFIEPGPPEGGTIMGSAIWSWINVKFQEEG